jgi:hypothetical protein
LAQARAIGTDSTRCSALTVAKVEHRPQGMHAPGIDGSRVVDTSGFGGTDCGPVSAPRLPAWLVRAPLGGDEPAVSRVRGNERGQWYLCEVPAATAIPPAHEVGLAQARVRHPTREELRLPLTAL